MSFAEKDYEDSVKFLNFISQKAKFDIDVKDIAEFHRLLIVQQGSILPKIKSNILEVRALHEAPKENSPPALAKEKGKSKKGK